MKKVFLTFVLTITFALPMLAPLAPHGLLHKLHDNFKVHHADNTDYTNTEGTHSHTEQALQNNNHPLHFDIVAYFNDYLHVDLQNAKNITLKASTQQDIASYLLNTILEPRVNLASMQNRSPPNYDKIFYSNNIYQAIQRIRI